jgi:hypothetical protein
MAEPAPQPGLECPRCGARYHHSARFCESCRLPLVHEHAPVPLEDAIDERHRQARKIKPQLAEGSLVSVAQARNQAEGEFIQGLLLEEGVPSLLRRSAGFDVPDFLAAGPRDVLVPQTGVETAREVLLQAEIISGDGSSAPRPVPVRLLAGLLVALIVGALVVWLLAIVVR